MQKTAPFNIELQHVEAALASSFVPISPRAEFVRQLGQQLVRVQRAPTTALKPDTRPGRLKVTLLSLAGVIMAVAFIAAGFRTAAALLALIGLGSEVGKQVKSRKAPPLSPAS